MSRNLARALVTAFVLTVVLGFAYPALMVGIGQGFFANAANGSLVRENGRVVGSRLAAQDFTSPGTFHPRPSATGYNAAGTSFSNLGPTNEKLLHLVRARARAYLNENRPYLPGLTLSQVPVDAVTSSGSGIDPEISFANAWIQAHRVAAVRHIPLARVDRLIRQADNTQGGGVFGQPGVNVLALNLALIKGTR